MVDDIKNGRTQRLKEQQRIERRGEKSHEKSNFDRFYLANSVL